MSKEPPSTKPDTDYWAKIDAGVAIRAMKRVVYQCTDEQLEPKYRDAVPPIRKREASIRCWNVDGTVDLDVVGVGLVEHVRGDSGRSPRTWDCVGSSDDVEPARLQDVEQPKPPQPKPPEPEAPPVEHHRADADMDGTVSNQERKQWNREHPEDQIKKS